MNSPSRGREFARMRIGFGEALNFVRALGQTWWVAGKMLVGG